MTLNKTISVSKSNFEVYLFDSLDDIEKVKGIIKSTLSFGDKHIDEDSHNALNVVAFSKEAVAYLRKNHDDISLRLRD